MAVTASCLLQVGAQLFAISMVASTIAEAPPRSFYILQGEYGYDSSAFWNIVPNVTFVLFIIALITNWKTQRKYLIALALILFIVAGLLAVFLLGPLYADLVKTGYSDRLDPALQALATEWYTYDWMVWALGLVAALILLSALTKSGEFGRITDSKS